MDSTEKKTELTGHTFGEPAKDPVYSKRVPSKTSSDQEWLMLKHNEIIGLRNSGFLLCEELPNNNVLFIDTKQGGWWRTNSWGKQIVDMIGEGRTVKSLLEELVVNRAFSRQVFVDTCVPFLRRAIKRDYLYLHPTGDKDTKEAESKVLTAKSNEKSAIRLGALWLEVTDSCQLDCPYCYASSEFADKNGGWLRLEDYGRLLSDPAAKTANRIVISGGEPTLREDLLDILRLCRETVCNNNSVSLVLVSNGIRQAPELWRTIAGLVDVVQISIDGPTAEVHDLVRGQGTFEKSIATFKILADTDLKGLHIAFTPIDINVDYIPAMVELAYQLDASMLHVTRLSLTKKCLDRNISLDYKRFAVALERAKRRAIRHMGIIAQTPEDTGRKRPFLFYPLYREARKAVIRKRWVNCGAGRGSLLIDPYGNAYPCVELRQPDFQFGNISDKSLSDLATLAQQWEDTICVDSIETCKDCSVRYICGGGCRAQAFICTGQINGKDPMCEFLKCNIKGNLAIAMY